ncbi:MAG: fumarylacetoacetate hydrolase family protein [Magnetococcus sp. MYC-9]
MEYVFEPHPPRCLTIVDQERRFPIRRIFCIGRNYAEHAREMGAAPATGHPFFFQKSPDAVVAQRHADELLTLCYPSATHDLQHEAELVVAIGRGGREIPPEAALAHIFGYAIGLDMTRRDLQRQFKEKGWPWDMAKNFTDSAPIGLLHPIEQTGELGRGCITLSVNGQRRQQGDLEQMIWPVPHMMAELSRLIELAAGDLLFTGTPAGVGRVVCQDRIRVTLDPLSSLEVTIHDAQGHYAQQERPKPRQAEIHAHLAGGGPTS